MNSETRSPKSESLTFTLPLGPLPVFVCFMLWPCLGVTLAVGATAFTLAFVVSDMDELMRRKTFNP